MRRNRVLPWHERGGPVAFFMLLWYTTVLLTTACTPQPAAGTLTIGLEASPTTLDPRFATDAYSARLGQLLFNRLVRFDPQFRPVPDLAERWTVEDGTYTFWLRRGVRFHDGRELTSEDVRATFESILDPARASPHRRAYEVIHAIDTPDRYTVQFHLKRPYAPFLASMGRGIVPRHLADDPDFAIHPVGTGPFRLVAWLPDDRLVLEAHPRYFAGPSRLSRIVVRIVPDETTRLLEVQKGSLQLVANAVPLEAVSLLNGRPELAVVVGEGTTYAYLGMNLRDPILRDVRVRRALAHAMNREAIITGLLRGFARPATGLLPQGHWAYEPEVARYPYDPGAARRLLDEAGYPDPDGDGPRTRLTLSYKTSTNEQARRVGVVLQEQLRKVGIGVVIRSFEWGTFYADIKAGNFQLYTLQWVGISDPDIYYDLFHSSNVPPVGANRGGYQNPVVDRLVEEGRRTLDESGRRAVYRRTQQILAEDLPYISLWHLSNVIVMRRAIRGFLLTPAADWYSLKDVRFG